MALEEVIAAVVTGVIFGHLVPRDAEVEKFEGEHREEWARRIEVKWAIAWLSTKKMRPRGLNGVNVEVLKSSRARRESAICETRLMTRDHAATQIQLSLAVATSISNTTITEASPFYLRSLNHLKPSSTSRPIACLCEIALFS